MHLPNIRTTAAIALPFLAICSLMADAPIWANAHHVKATYTECGQSQYVILRGDSVPAPSLRTPPGCSTKEVFFTQINIAKALLTANGGAFSEANVEADYFSCDGAPTVPGQLGVLHLGTPGDMDRGRMRPAPARCGYTRQRFASISSLGGISYTDLPNGGVMTVKESLDFHARERERAIAICNANPACRAEVQRRSAINAYYDCMKPLGPGEPSRTCYRPW